MKKTEYFTITNGLKRYKIKGTVINLANLIATNFTDNLRVYDDKGNFIVSTCGCFLDEVCDPYTREKILAKLLPLQLGKKTPKEIIYI